MMLQGGALDKNRILSEESFDAMTRLQTGDLKTGFVDGMGYGPGRGLL